MMRKMFLKVLVVVAMMVLFNSLCVTAHGVVWGNYSEVAYDDNGGEQKSAGSLSIDVIRGAGYFLDSYSGIAMFLNKYELAEVDGVDFAKLHEILNRALGNIKDVGNLYVTLATKTYTMPYNRSVLYALVDFDYAGFQEKNKLNPTDFRQVTYYLKKGNVRELHGRMLSNIREIEKLLTVLNEEVGSGVLPSAQDVWRLGQTYTRTYLFGQYTAMVFSDILRK